MFNETPSAFRRDNEALSFNKASASHLLCLNEIIVNASLLCRIKYQISDVTDRNPKRNCQLQTLVLIHLTYQIGPNVSSSYVFLSIEVGFRGFQNKTPFIVPEQNENFSNRHWHPTVTILHGKPKNKTEVHDHVKHFK